MIGFSASEYSVSEGGEAVVLTVKTRGGVTQCNETEWMVSFSLTPLSAQRKALHWNCNYHNFHGDSIPLFLAAQDYNISVSTVLNITDDSPEASVVVMILEDDFFEIDEKFRAEINLLQEEDAQCISLQPSAVDVTILDNDGD